MIISDFTSRTGAQFSEEKTNFIFYVLKVFLKYQLGALQLASWRLKSPAIWLFV